MQRHIIKQQVLDLQIPSQKGSFELQNRVSSLYRNKIIPLMDTVLSQLSDSDKIHRIDSLEIDLGTVDINDLEAQFVTKVEQQLRRRLAEAIESSDREQTEQEPSVETNEPQTAKESTTEDTLDQTHQKLSVKNKSQAALQATAKQPGRLRPSSKHSTQPDSNDSQLEIFKHFIQTGTLPWWAKQLSQQELAKCLEDLITHQPVQIKPVLLRTFQDQQQLRRLIEQFSDANLLAMVQLLVPGLPNIIANFNTDLSSILKSIDLLAHLSSKRLRLEQWRGILFSLTSGTMAKPDKRQLIRQTVLHIASSFGIPYYKLLEQIVKTVTQLQQSGQHFDSDLPDIIEQIHKVKSNQQGDLPQANTKQSTEKQSNTRSSETLDNKKLQLEQNELQRNKERFNDSDELYLANAGLIIFWPFLARLFETLDLVQAQEFKDVESAERAVHLLQYLVDEPSETAEHLLPLNKLLCGLDLVEPVSASIDISEQEKAECEKLLTAVIQHWTALKNTSIDGLRKAFLQREAILRIRDGGWLLQVERVTHDILLDNIPWSIRMVKLPWMENMIYVEW